MTNGRSPALAGYERTREEIHKKYQELVAARREQATRETRFLQVCQSLPPEYRPVDPTQLDRLRQNLDKLLGIFQGLMTDLAFPVLAYQDSRRWTNINGAASRASNLLTKMETHGSDTQTHRTGTVSAELVAGTGYPGRRGGPAFPWMGIGGDAYRSQIPRQRAAADRLGLIAVRVAGAVNSASVNVAFLYLAALAVFVVLIFSLKLLWLAMSALVSAAAWILASFRVAAQLSFVRTFLANLAALLWGLMDKILTAIATALATYYASKWAVSQQTLLIRNMLMEERPGQPYQSTPFHPGGRWPNPTKDEDFPHMTRDRRGQWRLSTLPEYEGR